MKYVEGDLLERASCGYYDIIVHGCNIHHVMGGGIARQIADTWPEAYEADKRTAKGSRLKLGKFSSYYEPNSEITIINLYIQDQIGVVKVDGFTRPAVDYPALYDGFVGIRDLYGKNLKIGIPQIGAGLAGGDWNHIENIIDSIGFTNLECVIYKP